jgi:hypothetical protein
MLYFEWSLQMLGCSLSSSSGWELLLPRIVLTQFYSSSAAHTRMPNVVQYSRWRAYKYVDDIALLGLFGDLGNLPGKYKYLSQTILDLQNDKYCVFSCLPFEIWEWPLFASCLPVLCNTPSWASLDVVVISFGSWCRLL